MHATPVHPRSDLFLPQPFKVDTAETERGIQVGYNQCNATTQGQNSLCQTLIVNSIEGKSLS